MNKRDLNERDICSKLITPAILKAGWDLTTQIREEVRFTKGRIIVRGKLVTRGKDKRADYILYFKPNIPIAIVEAKDNLHPMGAGLQQGLEYSATLGIAFVFASNGDGFIFHDKTLKEGEGDIEKTLTLDEFPSPAQLWEKYRAFKGLGPEEERIVLQDYHPDAPDKQPRYYQQSAINATVEAIAKGQDRNLLVMATGTGKTYTAPPSLRGAHRKAADEAISRRKATPFRHPGESRGPLTPDSRLTSPHHEDLPGLLADLLRPHRGGRVPPGQRRRRLGVARDPRLLLRGHADRHDGHPKETKYISNINYFGEPTYSYTLKQGIRDGFLAPYKVIKVHLDVDIEGYRPTPGEKDITGAVIPDCRGRHCEGPFVPALA